MRTIIIAAIVLGLAGCAGTTTTTALQSAPGQLFCAIQTGGGGTIVAGLVSAEVTGVAPAAGPIAVLATNATKAFVDNACAQAALNTGAKAAVPVSPPANPAAAPTVAVTPSAVAS